MSMAVCDPEAFYPLRNLVAGPFNDLRQLTEIERFVRTIVLHDEISMELTPWPYDPDVAELEEEQNARSAIVAIGPTLKGYDFFTEKLSGKKPVTPNVTLSSPLIEAARKFSNAEEGNVYYKAHIEFLKRIVSVLQKGGSALLVGSFGNASIGASKQFSEEMFKNLDKDWQEFALEANEGELGLVVPPVLSIILTRCAKREAIPAVIGALRDEWADARAKVWVQLSRLKTVNTIAETQEIRQGLEAASRLLSFAPHEIDTRPIRVLWNLVAGGLTGALIATTSGGCPKIGAAIGFPEVFI